MVGIANPLGAVVAIWLAAASVYAAGSERWWLVAMALATALLTLANLQFYRRGQAASRLARWFDRRGMLACTLVGIALGVSTLFSGLSGWSWWAYPAGAALFAAPQVVIGGMFFLLALGQRGIGRK